MYASCVTYIQFAYYQYYIFRGKVAVFTILCEQYQPSLRRDPSYTEVSVHSSYPSIQSQHPPNWPHPSFHHLSWNVTQCHCIVMSLSEPLLQLVGADLVQSCHNMVMWTILWVLTLHSKQCLHLNSVLYCKLYLYCGCWVFCCFF